MSTRISIDRLTKRFPAIGGGGGAAATTTAVDGISLTIDPGELFFLLGPSGCGKTTLLRMIAGFIDPSEGRISFEPTGMPARDVTHLPPNQRNTGMVFQSYALWPHMSVAKNVGFGLEVRKVSQQERERRVREALDIVRMGQYAERKPNQLSGGQQQRVALARALVIRPDVLLLDEPLSNLDAKLRSELRAEIRRICKSAGITSVYVTHDQKEALSMADRVAIVNQGRIVQVGTPGELYRRPRSRFVADFLGETNFIPCRRVQHADDPALAEVDSPAGRLRASAPAVQDAQDGGQTAGQAGGQPAGGGAGDLWCSIRPEAWRIGTQAHDNALSGRVIDASYLGESMHLTIELAGEVRVVATILNPREVSRVGESVQLSVAPEDVVLLHA